jgi:APA family basic amino acid/polyamine antiporter
MLLAYGIKQSAWVAGLCTVLELAGLAIVIAIGIPRLGSVDYFEIPAAGPTGLLSAATLVFFAYIGFEEIVQLSEETREPTKTLPRAVLLSIVISTVLYVVVAVCAVSVLDWERLGASESPLADVAAVSLGPKAFVLLSVIALFSTDNTVLILVMSAARLLYGMAEDGALPSGLARIHRTRKTPHVATLVVALAAMVVIVAFERIEVVANLTNFVMLATFAIVNAAAIVLRYREPDVPRPFKVPLAVGRMPVIPLLGTASSIFMLSYVGATAMVAGVLITLSGVVFVFFFRGRRTGGASPDG